MVSDAERKAQGRSANGVRWGVELNNKFKLIARMKQREMRERSYHESPYSAPYGLLAYL